MKLNNKLIGVLILFIVFSSITSNKTTLSNTNHEDDKNEIKEIENKEYNLLNEMMGLDSLPNYGNKEEILHRGRRYRNNRRKKRRLNRIRRRINKHRRRKRRRNLHRRKRRNRQRRRPRHTHPTHTHHTHRTYPAHTHHYHTHPTHTHTTHTHPTHTHSHNHHTHENDDDDHHTHEDDDDDDDVDTNDDDDDDVDTNDDDDDDDNTTEETTTTTTHTHSHTHPHDHYHDHHHDHGHYHGHHHHDYHDHHHHHPTHTHPTHTHSTHTHPTHTHHTHSTTTNSTTTTTNSTTTATDPTTTTTNSTTTTTATDPTTTTTNSTTTTTATDPTTTTTNSTTTTTQQPPISGIPPSCQILFTEKLRMNNETLSIKSSVDINALYASLFLSLLGQGTLTLDMWINQDGNLVFDINGMLTDHTESLDNMWIFDPEIVQFMEKTETDCWGNGYLVCAIWIDFNSLVKRFIFIEEDGNNQGGTGLEVNRCMLFTLHIYLTTIENRIGIDDANVDDYRFWIETEHATSCTEGENGEPTQTPDTTWQELAEGTANVVPIL